MKKLLILGIVFLALISFAHAEINISLYYSFHNFSCGDSSDMSTCPFNTNQTITETTPPISILSNELKHEPLGIYRWNFTQEGQFQITSGIVVIEFTLKLTSSANTGNPFDVRTTEPAHTQAWRVYTTDNCLLQVYDESSQFQTFTTTACEWKTYKFNYSIDTNTLDVFVNGTKVLSKFAVKDTAGLQHTKPSSDAGAGTFYWGNISIWNGSKYGIDKPPEIAGGGGGDVTPPVVTVLHPLNGTAHDTVNISLNWSVNEPISWSFYSLDLGVNVSLNQNITLTGLSEGHHSVRVFANDTSGNWGDSGFINFSIDLTSPTIKSDLENNNSLFYNSLTAQFNYTDNIKLFRINVTTPEGFSYQLEGVNVTEYSYNQTINISAYDVGRHNISTEVCDAHTDETISEWDYDVGWFDKELKFEFGKINLFNKHYISVKPKEPSHFSDVTVIKEDDRYKDSWIKKKGYEETEETYIVKSSEKIYIIKDSLYEGWLVIPELNKWRDFETEGKHPATIKRISDNEVEVTTSGNFFSSTGDLNCNNATYFYDKYGYETTANNTIIETENQTFTLSLNLTDTFIDSTNITASLTWNNTVYTLTKATSGNYVNFSTLIETPQINPDSIEKTFFFNYSFDGIVSYNTTEETQTIYALKLSVCNATFTTTALNFTLYDEGNQTNINGDLTASFTYWLAGQSSLTKTYDFTGTNNKNYTFCINPENVTIITDYNIYYEGAGYPQRRKTDNDVYVTSAIADLPLYLLQSSNGIYARFRTVDQYQNPVTGVEVVMNKSINGKDNIIEQTITDDAGLATVWANPDENYIFTFTKTGYEKETFTLRPTNVDIYNVVMDDGGLEENDSKFQGIYYEFFPKITPLINQTNYTFRFNATSDFWAITGCTLYLKHANGTVIQSSSATYSGADCDIAIELNTGNLTYILSQAAIEQDGADNVTYSRNHNIVNVYKGEFSLMNFLDDLGNFGEAGFDNFGRMLMAFIAILAITAAICSLAGLSAHNDTEIVIIIVWALVYIFAYIGWFSMALATFPSSTGFGLHMQKYAIFYLITMLGIGIIGWRNI